MEAFLNRYTAGMSQLAATATANLFEAWNLTGHVRQSWANFLGSGMEITAYTRRWADELSERPDLSEALVKFCAAKV